MHKKRVKVTAEWWEIVNVVEGDFFDCEDEVNDLLYDRIVNDDKCFDNAQWYFEDFGEVKDGEQ